MLNVQRTIGVIRVHIKQLVEHWLKVQEYQQCQSQISVLLFSELFEFQFNFMSLSDHPCHSVGLACLLHFHSDQPVADRPQ